jgi:hypothetical protein
VGEAEICGLTRDSLNLNSGGQNPRRPCGRRTILLNYCR